MTDYQDQTNNYNYSPQSSTSKTYRDEEKANEESVPQDATPGIIPYGNPNVLGKIINWKSISNTASAPKDLADNTSSNLGGLYLTCSTKQSIQDKIDAVSKAGGGTVTLQNGTHKPGGDIEIPSNVYLKGLNTSSCIIDFESEVYSIKIQGSDAYSTGTVTITNGDVTVTGAGTTWTDSMIGQYILLSGVWYPITARNSNTEIEIAIPYAGEDLAGDSYVIASRVLDAQLSTFTIQYSNSTGIIINYAENIRMTDIVVSGCAGAYSISNSSIITCDGNPMVYNAYGLTATNAHYMQVYACSSIDSFTGYGFAFDSCTSVSVTDSFSLNSTGNGFQFTDCGFISIMANNSIENGDNGYEFISGNNDVVMSNNGSQDNANDGISLTATTDNCIISTNLIYDNGGYGINIANANCDDNYIRNNKYSGNTSGKWSDSGTGTQTDNDFSNDFAAGDDLLDSADTERNSNSTSYVIKKEIEVNNSGGILRVKFDMKTEAGGTAYGKVYINNIAVGTEQTTTGVGYSTKTEDIEFETGDKIQLYIKSNNNAFTTFIRNFRLYYLDRLSTTVNTD